jgi:molecular chaperone GrpE
MSKKEHKEKDEMSRPQSELNGDNGDASLNGANGANDANEASEEPTIEEQLAQAQERVAELEDKNLRMMAEFDNYRKRTNKEKLDLMATAGERIFKDMLPLVDDFERALASINGANGDNGDALLNGVQLIYQKFIAFLAANDVHAIETEGADFNTDEHEAVTTFAAGEDKKGKVIDCTQKGYKLGEKVIRFAKVVVGE